MIHLRIACVNIGAADSEIPTPTVALEVEEKVLALCLERPTYRAQRIAN